MIQRSSEDTPKVERVLKDDVDARVVVIETGDGLVVEKSYATPRHVIWRTFGQRSKAKREHDNLAALHGSGVPCVRPIDYREIRRFGFMSSSTIATEWIADAPDLLHIFRKKREPRHHPWRRDLSEEYGRLIRIMHDRGFVSTSSSPRNILLQKIDDGTRLILCDQPQLMAVGRPIYGSWLASIDLFDIAFVRRRRDLFTNRERYRFLWGYTDGDRAAIRREWTRLSRRTRWTNQFGKRICHALARLPIRRFRPKAP